MNNSTPHNGSSSIDEGLYDGISESKREQVAEAFGTLARQTYELDSLDALRDLKGLNSEASIGASRMRFRAVSVFTLILIIGAGSFFIFSNPQTKQQIAATPDSVDDTTKPVIQGTESTSESSDTTDLASDVTTENSARSEDLPEGVIFYEDFSSGESLSRFDSSIFHRDDHVVRDEEWEADHASTGPNDECGDSDTRRTVTRGDREDGFNSDWVYRCVDSADAHLLTAIGDTSGYSYGVFTPSESFSDVTEVRWEVNISDLGGRQWTEVGIVPEEEFNLDSAPCSDHTCEFSYSDTKAVAAVWSGRNREIFSVEEPEGIKEERDFSGYDSGCDCYYGIGTSDGKPDPAVASVDIRRKNFLRDNGDGTLTWGFELEDGSFIEHSSAGSFPEGNAKVVFADHNVEPLKATSNVFEEPRFTWHWDNLEVHAE